MPSPQTAQQPWRDYSFVTSATGDFQGEQHRRRIRSLAMKGYLANASTDPNTRDRRIIHKKSANISRHGKRSLRSGHKASTEISAGNGHGLRGGETADRRSRHRVDALPIVAPRSQASIQSFPLVQIWQEDLRGSMSNPLIKDAPGQHEFVTLLQSIKLLALQDQAMQCKAFAETLISRMRIEPLRGAFDHLILLEDRRAWRRMPDDLWDGISTINLALLRTVAGAYCGSLLHELWVPLVMNNPTSHLSLYCVVAPYADYVMTSASRRHGRLVSCRQTPRCLSILARLLRYHLSIPWKMLSDETLMAIMHLHFCQALTREDHLASSHQDAMLYIIRTRGGLDQLGGGGVIAACATITGLAGAIWRDVPAAQIYRDWAAEQKTFSEHDSARCPDGPLFCMGPGMKSLATDRNCDMATMRIVLLVARIVDVTSQHIAATAFLDQADATPKEDLRRNRSLLQTKLQNEFARMHVFPTRNMTETSSVVDCVYESVRLTAMRFVHAIWFQRPLWKSNRCKRDDRCGDTRPVMVYKSLQGSPINPAWGHLVGVYHWILLVATNSCRRPVRTSEQMGASEPEAASSPATDVSNEPGTMGQGVYDDSAPSPATFSAGKVALAARVEADEDAWELPTTLRAISTAAPQPVGEFEQTEQFLSESYAEKIRSETFRDDLNFRIYSAKIAESAGLMTETEQVAYDRRSSELSGKLFDTSSYSLLASEEDYTEYDHMCQFFKVNAGRVCGMLQFQYPYAQMQALMRMERIVSWLREGVKS